ncbi:hypothetical protein WI90_01700 [Burkholderia ubonensis]|nr:hypothetical protein WI90_01700 [Burkholderia ubonensis]
MPFRWDAPLFYANVEIFCEHLHAALTRAPSPVTCVVVASEPVTDIDVSAADRLVALCGELGARGIALCFAEMKGPVKDRLRAYELFDTFGQPNFFPTVPDAVAHHVRQRTTDTRTGRVSRTRSMPVRRKIKRTARR